jgi:rhomboid family GlyGly-CTERM serine protease
VNATVRLPRDMLQESPVRAARRGVRAALLLPALALLIYVVPGLADPLSLQRAAVLDGQWWRILTGHLTHFTLSHLLWDVGTLLVLGILAEGRSRAQFAAAVLGSAVLISAAVLWLQPQLSAYRGLSGIDSALFGLVAVTLLCEQLRQRSWLVAAAIAAALLGFGGKIAFELLTHTAMFARDLGPGVMPVALAHIVGGAWGALVALAPPIQRAIPPRLQRPSFHLPAQ